MSHVKSFAQYILVVVDIFETRVEALRCYDIRHVKRFLQHVLEDVIRYLGNDS